MSNKYQYRKEDISSAQRARKLIQKRKGKLADKAIENVFGVLADKTNHLASIEEIEEAIAEGWANVEEDKKR